MKTNAAMRQTYYVTVEYKNDMNIYFLNKINSI